MMQHRAPSGRSNGFTLIEVSVVVLIMAMLLTTATVRLDAYLPSSRNEAAARELLSTLDLARTSAVAYGRVYTLEMDLGGERYRIRLPYDTEGRPARDADLRAAMDWHKLPPGVHFGGILDTSGVLLTEGLRELPFDAIGSAEELYVYLDNEAGEGYALTVRVQALTGASAVILGRVEPIRVTEDDF